MVVLQVLFDLSVYRQARQVTTSSAPMVAYYTGWGDPNTVLKPWAVSDPKPKLLISGAGMDADRVRRSYGLSEDRLIIESEARTTDQNARYSAPLIKASGVKTVLLALPWYQMPRAVFLTRLYLWGSGVQVTPYLLNPLPERWYLDRFFLWEMVKFWGSLGRVTLSWVGIEDWPPHFGYGKFDRFDPKPKHAAQSLASSE